MLIPFTNAVDCAGVEFEACTRRWDSSQEFAKQASCIWGGLIKWRCFCRMIGGSSSIRYEQAFNRDSFDLIFLESSQKPLNTFRHSALVYFKKVESHGGSPCGGNVSPQKRGSPPPPSQGVFGGTGSSCIERFRTSRHIDSSTSTILRAKVLML